MTIAVLPNLSKQNARLHTVRLVEKLHSLGAGVSMRSDFRSSFENMGVVFFDCFEEMVAQCDMMIAVGGDGTIIHCARHAAAVGKPILGVNVGRLGFVAGLETDEFDKLERLFSGDYQTEERMMLEIRVDFGEEQKTYAAFNDAVIQRDVLSPMPDFKVRFNDTKVCDYRADGLIFSTPTGSTAYSLSTGGPVIDPQLSCILLSPICPHSLMTRPVVFAPQAKLTVQAEFESGSKIYLTMDGENPIRISDGVRKLDFYQSQSKVKIIKLKNNNFYEIVNEKLGERKIGL